MHYKAIVKSLAKKSWLRINRGVTVNITHSSIVLLVFIFLAGCAPQLTPAPPSYQLIPWQQRANALANIQNWQFKSALSIITPHRATIAAIDWQQTGRHFFIHFSGPFFIGDAIIQGYPGTVTFTTARNETYTASTPEKLLQTQLGWQLPISNLNYWIRGLPVPGEPATTQFDQYDHLIQLKQHGWTIHYTDFQPVGKIDLPRKMTLDSASLKVKLAIQEWQISLPSYRCLTAVSRKPCRGSRPGPRDQVAG